MRFAHLVTLESMAAAVAARILKPLRAGQRVLVLLAGGSAVPVEIKLAEQLRNAGVSLQNLTVSLTDERYVPLAHADSNWQQLTAAGLALPGAHLHPVLQAGATLPQTAEAFDAFLAEAFSTHTYRLGLFGIGADGHTAGILPRSAAVTAAGLATSYVSTPYQRITVTFSAISRLDEAVAYAAGEAKWPVLEQLQSDTPLPLADQPAQILKQVPALTIFNDRIGETV